MRFIENKPDAPLTPLQKVAVTVRPEYQNGFKVKMLLPTTSTLYSAKKTCNLIMPHLAELF
jgi:hypothetical protein